MPSNAAAISVKSLIGWWMRRVEARLSALLLQRILEQVGGEHANASAGCFDDAAWVGWRLVELLPLEPLQRQALLQQDDPHARLDSLLALLP